LAFPHLPASHGVSPRVNFLLINGIKIVHSAIDFFLISFPGICIDLGPRFHNLDVKESIEFFTCERGFFPSFFRGGFRNSQLSRHLHAC